jgi:hypothetical protein
MSDEEKAQHVRTVCPKGDGEHHVELCPICVRPTWKWSDTSKPKAVVVVLGEEPCDACLGFQHLHPAVFEFVTHALRAQRFIAKRLVSETGE